MAHLWSTRPLVYGAFMTYQTRFVRADHCQGANTTSRIYISVAGGSQCHADGGGHGGWWRQTACCMQHMWRSCTVYLIARRRSYYVRAFVITAEQFPRCCGASVHIYTAYFTYDVIYIQTCEASIPCRCSARAHVCI
jgi:hypothetical protein